MFDFTLSVLNLMIRFLRLVIKDELWDSRPYRFVRSAEGWVATRQWEFYLRWFRLRSAMLTRDPLLRQVLATHLLYEGRGSDLFVRPRAGYCRDGQDVTFFAIGHNSSHEWSAGVKDGKVLIKSCGEDFVDVGPMPEPQEGEPDESFLLRYAEWEMAGRTFVEKVREVVPGEGWGYCGHF